MLSFYIEYPISGGSDLVRALSRQEDSIPFFF